MTVAEIVYSCLDLSKAATSDDSYLTEELVVFLLNKYRSFLLKKEHDKDRGSQDVASEFEYQQICIDLEKSPAIDGSPCTGGYYLRSVQAIPEILEGSSPKLYPIDYYQGSNITYVSRDRMRYIGSNPYLKNVIYTSVAPDLHLYLNSSNPQFLYLKKLRMSAIFNDVEKAGEMACDDEGNKQSCDILDMEFPIRASLVPPLIELVIKELTGAKYQYRDNRNNADDDSSKVNSTAR